MGVIEDAEKRYEELEEEEKNKGTEEEERRKSIIKIFKKSRGREPTEEEIEKHTKFILRCKKEIFGPIRE
jgi:hypothetical protein